MQMIQDTNDIKTTLSLFAYGKVTGAIFYDTRRIKKGDTFPAKYRITFQRKQIYFDSGFSFSLEDWEHLPNTRNKDLLLLRKMLYDGHKIIESHVKHLVDKGNFTFDQLTKRISKGDARSVNSSFESKIKTLETNGQVGTAMLYTCSLNSLSAFNQKKEIKFSNINPDWLTKYEKHFIDEGNSYATLSIYIRNLRTIFNESRKDGNISDASYPFGRGRYEIPSSPGRHMALNIDQIKTLFNHPVEPGSTTEKMKDLWTFSYLTNGINIKDIVCLKWKNIVNDEIVFQREKTKNTTRDKRPIVSPILPDMKRIIDKHGNTDRSPESYVFGFLRDDVSPQTIRLVSQNVTRLMNKHLVKIAEKAKLPHISSYTARHSFSTILLRNGASIEFISEALGHQSTSSTRNYLSGFETDAKRKMNSVLTDFKATKQLKTTKSKK